MRTFLTLTGGFEVVGEASNGLEAVHLVETLYPQVVLMDIDMPIMDGYEAIRQIKLIHPACRVIALMIHAGEQEQQRAIVAGVVKVMQRARDWEYIFSITDVSYRE